MKSFLTIQKKVGDNWKTVLTDNDWETQFHWKRIKPPLGSKSQAIIRWEIPSDVTAGTYRIIHNGHYRIPFISFLIPTVVPYQGISREFDVIN